MKFSKFCGFTNLLFLSIGLFSDCQAFDLDKDLKFRLYTREQPDKFQSLNVSSISVSLFNPKRPTRIFTHGFLSSEPVLIRYKDAFLKLNDFNVICVDWIAGAKTYNYLLAKSRVQAISALLNSLVFDHGLRLQDVMMVGHSLGSHISGRAAKQLKSSEKIGCIIGLDPASVGIDYYDKTKRLADSDAVYVEIIHTDSDKFGFYKPLGHADFYPNGGKRQPGCPLRNAITNLVEKCSHVRAHHLFLESLNRKFRAIQCESFEEIKNKRCTTNNVTALMGGDISPTTPKAFGIFYLETNEKPPYNILDVQSFNRINIIFN